MTVKETIKLLNQGNPKDYGKYNKVLIIGHVEENLGENEWRYMIRIRVKRNSDKYDFLYAEVKKVLVDRTIRKGDLVKITGAFTSAVWNGHKKSYITAKKIEFLETDDKFEDVNIICLRGFMCDKPYYREKQKSKKGEKTKKGISTFCLAVPRKVKKNDETDYIQCVAWKIDAALVKDLEPRQEILLYGRIEYREFEVKSQLRQASINEVSIHQNQIVIIK